MPVHLKSVDCNVIFEHPTGTYSFDATEIDLLIYSFSKDKSGSLWMVDLKNAISEKYNIPISLTDTYRLIQAANQALEELKKTEEDMQKSQASIASTPSS